MAQYKYYTQKFIKEGVNFAEIFVEKQKKVAGQQNVAYSLPDIVEFIRTQSDEFTKQDQYLIDLDIAVMNLVKQYRNVTETPKEEIAKELQPKQSYSVGAGMTPIKNAEPAKSEPEAVAVSENLEKENLEASITILKEYVEDNPEDEAAKISLTLCEEMHVELYGTKMEDGGSIELDLTIKEKAKYFTFLDKHKDDKDFLNVDSGHDALSLLDAKFNPKKPTPKKPIKISHSDAVEIYRQWKVSRGFNDKYEEGGDVLTGADKQIIIKYKWHDLEGLYDLLGGHDIIVANEINPSSHFDYLLSEGEDIYFLTGKNIAELKEKGETSLKFEGPLDKFIDKSNPSDIDFLKWLNGGDYTVRLAKGGEINTLAALKKKLQKGQAVKLVSWFGQNEQNATTESAKAKLGKTRYVVKVQTNGVYLSPDKEATDGSYWEFPAASLVEVNNSGFKVYGIGERPLSPQEAAVMANEPKDAEQDRIDAMSDGSTMYYRRKRYYAGSGFPYLDSSDWYHGLRRNPNRNTISDKSIKGALELEYEFVDENSSSQGTPKQVSEYEEMARELYESYNGNMAEIIAHVTELIAINKQGGVIDNTNDIYNIASLIPYTPFATPDKDMFYQDTGIDRDTLYFAGGGHISNRDAASDVAARQQFNASNLQGLNIGDSYVVLSYGYYPVFVYNNGKWYENDNGFSSSTRKQMGQVRPSGEIIKKTTEQLKDIYEGRAKPEPEPIKAGDKVISKNRDALRGIVEKVKDNVITAKWEDLDGKLVPIGKKKVFDIDVKDVIVVNQFEKGGDVKEDLTFFTVQGEPKFSSRKEANARARELKEKNSGLTYKVMKSGLEEWSVMYGEKDFFGEQSKDKFEKGGDVKDKKKWIQKAVSGGKKGALRKTAMKKGLLRSKKEKLSKTDLKKLEKMGGKTAKRAHLAETLSKLKK